MIPYINKSNFLSLPSWKFSFSSSPSVLLLPFSFPLDLFENAQVALEQYTEQLANMIENKSPEELLKDRENIINQIRILEKVREGLIEEAEDWTVSFPFPFFPFPFPLLNFE